MIKITLEELTESNKNYEAKMKQRDLETFKQLKSIQENSELCQADKNALSEYLLFRRERALKLKNKASKVV